MSQGELQPYLWMPGRGPDAQAIDRMARAFPKPRQPMGEAWFMGETREMYTRLSENVEDLLDDYLRRALEEICSGLSCFGPYQEWVDWYDYLLPRLANRHWRGPFQDDASVVFTPFFCRYPDSSSNVPYREFISDALNTLGRVIMSPQFWPDGELDVAKGLGKLKSPSGIAGWSNVGKVLSASLFFCIKYLPDNQIEPWFRSAIAIPNRYWQLQVATWLVGAHPILSGKISHPAEFPEDGPHRVGWEWSHCLRGNYTGAPDASVDVPPFLPEERRNAFLKVAFGWDAEPFLEDFETDPATQEIAWEVPRLAESFRELYRQD